MTLAHILAKKLGIMLSVLALAAIPTIQAYAEDAPITACPPGMSKADCEALYGNWVNWKMDSGCSLAVGTVLSGSDVQSKIFSFFVGKGLSPSQAAGIMGNMQAESGFRPSAEQTEGAWSNISTEYNHAVGLVQWDGGRRVAIINHLKDMGLAPNGDGVDPDTYLGAQLDYIWDVELNGTYQESTLIPLQATTTAADATLIFHQKYEVSADGPDKIQGRINNAQAIVNTYGGGVPTAAGGTSAATGCSGGVVAGNIIATALGLAWPDNNGHTDPNGATDAYKAAWNGASNMTDCGAFVSTVMTKSGVDPTYPAVDTGAQKEYVLTSGKYITQTNVTDSSGLQPGDILVYGVAGAGHTMIYVGPQEGGYLVADASWDGGGIFPGHTPMLNSAGDLSWMLSQTGLVVARIK